VAHDRGQWWALANMEMNVVLSYDVGKFLSISATGGLVASQGGLISMELFRSYNHMFSF
jgi:hypothetical protein